MNTDKNMYEIVAKFDSNENAMLVVKMNGATCIMTESEYNRVIESKRKYNIWKQKNKVA